MLFLDLYLIFRQAVILLLAPSCSLPHTVSFLFWWNIHYEDFFCVHTFIYFNMSSYMLPTSYDSQELAFGPLIKNKDHQLQLTDLKLKSIS